MRKSLKFFTKIRLPLNLSSKNCVVLTTRNENPRLSNTRSEAPLCFGDEVPGRAAPAMQPVPRALRWEQLHSGRSHARGEVTRWSRKPGRGRHLACCLTNNPFLWEPSRVQENSIRPFYRNLPCSWAPPLKGSTPGTKLPVHDLWEDKLKPSKPL